MPHLGVPELLIILVIFVLVFGVGKLPQIGKALGQGMRDFREATQGLGEEDASGADSGKSAEAEALHGLVKIGTLLGSKTNTEHN